jgi:hypothetical protein
MAMTVTSSDALPLMSWNDPSQELRFEGHWETQIRQQDPSGWRQMLLVIGDEEPSIFSYLRYKFETTSRHQRRIGQAGYGFMSPCSTIMNAAIWADGQSEGSQCIPLTTLSGTGETWWPCIVAVPDKVTDKDTDLLSFHCPALAWAGGRAWFAHISRCFAWTPTHALEMPRALPMPPTPALEMPPRALEEPDACELIWADEIISSIAKSRAEEIISPENEHVPMPAFFETSSSCSGGSYQFMVIDPLLETSSSCSGIEDHFLVIDPLLETRVPRTNRWSTRFAKAGSTTPSS